MNEQDEQSDGPRGIDHDRIQELTKEYRSQMEADPEDPVSARVQQESADWAAEVQAGRYPTLEGIETQRQELRAARHRVQQSLGRTTGLRQVDPGMSQGILREPARPPELPVEEAPARPYQPRHALPEETAAASGGNRLHHRVMRRVKSIARRFRDR